MGQDNISTRSWGCLGGLLRRGSGDLGEVGKGTFSEAPQAGLRLIRAYRFLPPPYSPEHALPARASARHQYVAMGIESEEIAKQSAEEMETKPGSEGVKG